mgnify:FL=1
MFWLVALTALHPGVGRSEEAHVDLPVQRDEFGLPTIWASSLKGALRARFELDFFRDGRCVAKPEDCANFLAAFGPRPESASDFASPAAFLDAKLVAIPARSLRGVWLYVTSPLLLSFVKLYAEAVGAGVQLPELPRPGEGSVYVTSERYKYNGYVVINERKYAVAGDVKPLDLPPFEEVKKIVGDVGFAVVSDEDVVDVVKRSLMVQYRVRLKQDSKTVETGPWSEEYIPPFAVFVSGYYCARRRPQRVKVKMSDGEDVEVDVTKDPCEYVEEVIKGPAWLGGKETVGRGLVKVI